MSNFLPINTTRRYLAQRSTISIGVLTCIFTVLSHVVHAQVEEASHSGFSWISTEDVSDPSYGSGYTYYSAAWPIFKDYPGPQDFQMGLAGCWLTTQQTGDEPDQFYTTIEGGLGWWHDTRFGTKVPKFIMGGVSYNFHSWANGPGAGRTDLLPNGERDWSQAGGKYGVAQLSNKLLWAPDGLNIAQAVNGELLGYGYTPLPLSEPMSTTAGQDIETGNQCWTLFLNSTNFKGPATFFLPTFWTEPVLLDPSIEGFFLDSRPSDPNIGFGIEHAEAPALISEDEGGIPFAKIGRMQYPANNQSDAIAMHQVSVFSQDALWNDMAAWFDGGPAIEPPLDPSGIQNVAFVNNGGSSVGEIVGAGLDHEIDLSYIDNFQQNVYTMGFEFDENEVIVNEENFILPEYFTLNSNDDWEAIDESEVPATTDLLDTEVPLSPRPELTYLSPLEPDCQWQDLNGPWNSPGPTAGPFQAELGDGSTVTYYWYRFIDQPAVINADLPEDIRDAMQERVELIHSNWSHTEEYLTPPSVGELATLDPGVIVQPPVGLEIGYVPIVTRQEATPSKVRVFVLAGQSNMQGYGTIGDNSNTPGTLTNIIANDVAGDWTELGEVGDWNSLDDAWLYYASSEDTIRANVTVGQGAFPDLIGPELMFAHEIAECYEDPVLIIKTAWGGKNLAADFRPPSAGGVTGEYYEKIIETVQDVTQNLDTEFPDIGITDFEISGFAWFQGWNDGESQSYLDEYESNLYHLVDDIRIEFENPELAVVVANSGHGGFETSSDLWVQDMQNIVSVAQEAVGCNDTLYGGTVGFVETKQFYIDETLSPADAIHHFHNNALTFLNIGKGLGNEMNLAVNDMAYCYNDCDNQTAPGVVSIGNRVWNDYDQDGVNDPDEPGIPDVSVVLWGDGDGDEIPDWQGFGGVQVTDENGYYNFSGLVPGNYVVFVWSLDNWGPGEPLEGFISTNGFVANADNDVDNDNNGSGNPFTDIMSGIVTLSSDDEPLNDGDPFNCYFNYDGSGNNTIDFGFYNPDPPVGLDGLNITGNDIELSPNPAQNEFRLSGVSGQYQIEISDAAGRLHQKSIAIGPSQVIDVSALPGGLYFVGIITLEGKVLKVEKLVIE